MEKLRPVPELARRRLSEFRVIAYIVVVVGPGMIDANAGKERLLRSLQQTVELEDFWLFLLRTDPTHDLVRNDPRFAVILRPFDPPQQNHMKRCPECRRDYTDETLNFCLDDGNALLDGPTSFRSSEFDAMTAVLPSFDSSLEATTRSFSILGEPVAAVPNNTIAVLPFLNLNPETESDYFSDGLSEELINVLSKIRRLRVAARTSAFSFKQKQTTVTEIGRILNVASVLEGSVRKANERVRISVQLVMVEDGYQIWSETYDRTMDDIFAVQDDIAQSVVEEIRITLLGDKRSAQVSEQVVSEVAEAMKGRAANPEAQRLMLLGRHFLDRTTREDTTKAVEYFREALDLDPGYALCWAELGRAYSVEAGSAWRPVDEGFDLSRDAVKRALSLEPDLAEAHAQQGRIQAAHERDLAGAEASYLRAMELAPGSSSVLDGASVLAYKMGRMDEAIDLSRRVLAQDPLSAAFWHNLGLTCHAAGILDESEQAFRRALELAPQRFVSGALLAMVLLDQGRTDEALEQAMKEHDQFWRTWGLAIIYHTSGRDAESDEALRELTEEHAAGNAYQIAEVHSVRGENEEAFEWLERAIAERDPGVTHAKVNPRFRPLVNDLRWPGLLSKIGF